MLEKTYIEKGSIAPIQVLHVIGNIAQYLDEESRALLVDVGQKSQCMLEVFEARRPVIAGPLVDRVHQSKSNHEQGLAVYQAGLAVGGIRRMVVDPVQSLLKVVGLDQREDRSDIDILHPEQALGELVWRKLGKDWINRSAEC